MKSCWLVGKNCRIVPQAQFLEPLIGWELFSLIWISNSARCFSLRLISAEPLLIINSDCFGLACGLDVLQAFRGCLHLTISAQRAQSCTMLVQLPLLANFLKRLDLVAFSEIFPIVEAHTALAAFAHIGHILLDVLE